MGFCFIIYLTHLILPIFLRFETENAWAVAIDDYHMYVADGSTLLDYYENESLNGEYNLLATVELSNAIKDITVGQRISLCGYWF